MINFSLTYLVCEPVPIISDGSIALQDNGNNSYGALANVTCNTGYNASLDSIECLDTGEWENTSCDIVGMYFVFDFRSCNFHIYATILGL